MQLELVLASQRGQDGHRERAPRSPIEALPRPHRSPGVAGDEVLESSIELGAASERPVDVVVPEHLSPNPHAGLVDVLAHGDSPAAASARSISSDAAPKYR